MRTTIRIDDEILAAAKRQARRTGQTLGAVIEAALRRASAVDAPTDPVTDIPVFTGGSGPAPGVDLDSNRALYELLDDGTDLDRRR